MFTISMALLVAGATFTFDKDKVGQAPAGFDLAVTKGDAASGQWSVEQDGSGRVLAYTAKQPGEAFGVAVAKGRSYKDVDVSVRIKTVGGAYQAAGVVWHYKDARNYYVVRLKAVDKNVHLFRVVDGVRSSIKGADAPSLSPKNWQKLRVEHRAGTITVSLAGAKLFSAEDKTFGEGRVGVWFKDDTAVRFDDLDAQDAK